MLAASLCSGQHHQYLVLTTLACLPLSCIMTRQSAPRGKLSARGRLQRQLGGDRIRTVAARARLPVAIQRPVAVRAAVTVAPRRAAVLGGRQVTDVGSQQGTGSPKSIAAARLRVPGRLDLQQRRWVAPDPRRGDDRDRVGRLADRQQHPARPGRPTKWVAGTGRQPAAPGWL